MSLKKVCIFFLSVVSLFFCLRGVYFCYNKLGNFNKMIFPRAYEERDFKEEYKNNFFVENQYLYYIDTLNKKLEFVEKMDYEEYKNEAFVNKIPCILLSSENQETKAKKCILLYSPLCADFIHFKHCADEKYCAIQSLYL